MSLRLGCGAREMREVRGDEANGGNRGTTLDNHSSKRFAPKPPTALVRPDTHLIQYPIEYLIKYPIEYHIKYLTKYLIESLTPLNEYRRIESLRWGTTTRCRYHRATGARLRLVTPERAPRCRRLA